MAPTKKIKYIIVEFPSDNSVSIVNLTQNKKIVKYHNEDTISILHKKNWIKGQIIGKTSSKKAAQLELSFIESKETDNSEDQQTIKSNIVESNKDKEEVKLTESMNSIEIEQKEQTSTGINESEHVSEKMSGIISIHDMESKSFNFILYLSFISMNLHIFFFFSHCLLKIQTMKRIEMKMKVMEMKKHLTNQQSLLLKSCMTWLWEK